MPQRFGVWRLGSFQLGLGTLWLALASPLEVLAEMLLQAHMVQHLVLMMMAPLLLVYGAPTLPLLRGVQARARTAAGLYGVAAAATCAYSSSPRMAGIRRGHGCLACPGAL